MVGPDELDATGVADPAPGSAGGAVLLHAAREQAQSSPAATENDECTVAACGEREMKGITGSFRG